MGLAALEVGIDTALVADLKDVRDKSQKLGKLFIQLVQQNCPDIQIASPEEDDKRGSHVSIQHEQGYAVTRALADRGVVVDFRAPDVIRFGFAPLYTSYENIWDTVEHLTAIIQDGSWDKEEYKQKATVT